jgi:IMP cyclohydrolase
MIMRVSIDELLRGNPYPGRGIIFGLSENGERTVLVYFIMGRSANSRNRVFERASEGIRIKAFDPGMMTDPSLVIYDPVRFYDGLVIVTNGDQTDTIHEHLVYGLDYRNALQTRVFEPDAPNYTPRISGLMEPDGSCCLSILKTSDGDPSCCCRYFYEYPVAIPGSGRFLSTYMNDGNPLPSFEGEPVLVSISVPDGIESFALSVWNSLNEENKVSLYARETSIATGKSFDMIINKNT